MNRREAVFNAAYAHKDEPGHVLTLANMIADAVEVGLTFVPQYRCSVNSKRGMVCRMNEGHIGSTHRSANGEEW